MPFKTVDPAALRDVPFFASLLDTDIERLASTLVMRNFDSEAVLIREGDPGHYFYILLSGNVEIVKALGSGDARLLATHGPGDFVGEMSLINPDGIRTASVRADGNVTALELGREAFEQLLKQYPSLALEMMRVLSRNLEVSNNATIRDLHEKNRQLTLAFEELKAAQARIIESEKLEHELALAREIQQSILPRVLPELPGFDFGVRMLPARAVGGDLYDFISLEGNRVGIAVGDVSDKGVPAAIFMALTTSLMRAEAHRSATPQEALRSVNRHLLGMNASGMFVTMLYGILDPADSTFRYARAGHELPIRIEATGESTPVPHDSGVPLGLLDDITLDVQTVVLSPGSALVIQTDGVTDALNAQQERFGSERLLEQVRKQRASTAQMLCDSVVRAVNEFAGDVTQFDDITIAAVLRTAMVSGKS